jgi:hypothetical protein
MINVSEIDTMLQLHHYTNTSVTPAQSTTTDNNGHLPAYDGKDYLIPGHTAVILVPCNDPRCQTPSARTCLLVNRDCVQRADNTRLLVMYMIDNTSADGLWLRHGDPLGAPCSLNRCISAERSLMMISYYEELINDLDGENYSAPPGSPRPDSPVMIDFDMSMRSPRPPNPLDMIDEMDNLDLCD